MVKNSKIRKSNNTEDFFENQEKLDSIISEVADQKIVKKEIVEVLVKEKLKQEIKKTENNKKSGKLRDFLQKSQKTKHEAQIKKTENINCPDCGFNLYDGGKSLALCICYGEDWNKNIKIEKSENSIKMKFPKTIDPENIEMLLKTLKNINKE